MKYFNFLNSRQQYNETWSGFINSIKPELKIIEKKILGDEDSITPDKKNILRFLKIPLSGIKIVILGQDPYPQPGVATGRAFEVSYLENWYDTFKYLNPSLQNLMRTVYKTYTGRIVKYSEFKRVISDEKFKILPPAEWFNSLEAQGVLFLNTAYTCRINSPGSHSDVWQNFSRELLTYIHDKKSGIVWFLWGNHADEITSHLNDIKAIRNYHPSRCFDREKDMLYGPVNPFEKTRGIIDWRGCK